MSKVAIFTDLYPPAVSGGGPIRSTEAMVDAAPNNFEPLVITSDRDLGESRNLEVESNRWIVDGRAKVRYTTASSLVSMLKSFKSVRIEKPNIIHINSFFSPRFSILPLLLWRANFFGKTILLLAPRGEFGEGALLRSNVKKKVYIAAIRLLRVPESVLWHSTSEHESVDIKRQMGNKVRVIERENHTLLPLEPITLSAEPQESVRFVFLGRIVEHKGLAIILNALLQIDTQVSLDIFGPSEDVSYLLRCKSIVESLPNNINVTFKGRIEPSQVRETLATYDALLMPTAGENFGHVIAESLSASCPVFSTPFTPWSSELNAGGGFVVQDREPSSWGTSIDYFLGLSPESRSELRGLAGDVYRDWRSRPEKPHVWDMAFDALNS